jgi:hypothetical protein
MANNLEREFCSYEQALALKELGFEYEKFYNYTSPMINLAPLKQQVFRWFREKYFLDCEIYLQEELGHKFYHYLVLQLVRGNIEWKSKNNIKFKTYEEAENACIDKLIELVKQQDND